MGTHPNEPVSEMLMRYGNDDFVPVVLGTGLSAYNVARSLHQAYGVRTLALGRMALRETARSRIIDVRTPAGFESPEGIVAALITVAEEFRGRTLVLFPNIEFYANVVSEHRETLAAYYRIAMPEPDLARRLIDKTDFYAECAAHGLNYPETVVIPAARSEFGGDLPFDFPVILKPSDTDVYQAIAFRGKEKVYVIASASELEATVELVRTGGYTGDLIVQEYLAGDESVMRVVNTYSDTRGRMTFYSEGQIVVAQRNPRLVGNYEAIIPAYDETLREQIQAFLEGTGYTGAANFDVMEDRRTGAAKVLEVNLRQGAATYYSMAAGGNLNQCIIEDLVYGRSDGVEVTGAGRLWVNVPALVAVAFAAPSLRSRARRLLVRGTRHTLKYRRDAAPRRLLEVARLDLRHALDLIRFRKNRPGQGTPAPRR